MLPTKGELPFSVNSKHAIDTALTIWVSLLTAAILSCLFLSYQILVWFIGRLCERAFRSRLTLREDGSGGALGETPNGLSASATLANGQRECQYNSSCESPIAVPKTQSAFDQHALRTASRRRETHRRSGSSFTIHR